MFGCEFEFCGLTAGTEQVASTAAPVFLAIFLWLFKWFKTEFFRINIYIFFTSLRFVYDLIVQQYEFLFTGDKTKGTDSSKEFFYKDHLIIFVK